jgi:hypothetical protein
LQFSGVTFSPITLTAGSGTVIFDGKTADQTIPVFNYNHLQIDKYSGSVSYTANAVATGINVDGDFTVTSGIFKADPSNAGWSHTIAGNWNINSSNASFNSGVGTIILDGLNQSVTQNNYTFYNLNIGDGIATPTVSIIGNLKIANNLTIKSSGTLNLNNNTGHNINGNLTIENTGKIDLTTGMLAVTNGVTNNGTVDMDQVSILNCNAFTNIATGVLDFGSSASQITVSANWNDYGTVNPGNSTVNLTGSNKIISTSNSTDFYHLNINGSYTANNGLDVSGNLTINGSFNPGSFFHRIAGNWNDSSGTFTGGSSTIVFCGVSQSVNTDVGSGNNKFFNLFVGDGSATPTVSIFLGKDLEVSNNLVVKTGAQLILNSNVVHTVGGSCTITGTLNTSTGKITVSGSVINSGAVDASASSSTSQGLKSFGLTNTGTLNFGVSGAGIIECDGNWFDTGTFTLGNSTVKIMGSSRTIKANRATGDFYKLIISSSSSIDSGSANGLDIDNTLLVNNGATFDLGVGFTHDVASICDIGDASTSGTININNSKFIAHGNFILKNGSTLVIHGSNTAANIGELRIGNNATVYIEGFLQTNPSASYTYKPKITRAGVGERYDFIVQNNGSLDLNGLIFEYAKRNGLTIASTSLITSIDIDNVDFQYVEEDSLGSGQGNGARHLYIGFSSGSYVGNFDGCLFDTSFGPTTGNNIIAAATGGSTVINFTNWSGSGAGDQYEYQESNTSIIWIAEVQWLGGALGHLTDWNWGANWSTGSKPGEGSSVIISNVTYAPTLNETTMIASLQIQDGGIFNMNTTYDLTVNGATTINSGTTGGKINITNSGAVLTCKSDLIDNNSSGGFIQTAGKIVLLGANSSLYAQTVKTVEIGDGTTAVNITTPSGKNITFASNGVFTVKASANYTLNGGIMTLGDGTTINVNYGGKFRSNNQADITTVIPGVNRFYFLVNGQIDIDGCNIRSMTANGLDIQSSATIINIKNISFYNHANVSTGRYLSIAPSNLDLDCPGCWFETITSGYNVSATGTSSVIRFQDRFAPKQKGLDLITTAGAVTVTANSASFSTAGITGGDILRIEGGQDKGTYIVGNVISQTVLTLTSSLLNTASGITYAVGTAFSGRGAGEIFDYDNDANNDGVADSSGAVIIWGYASNMDMSGAIQGFPTAAFDLDTYAYYSTYAVSRDYNGTSDTADRIAVLDNNGLLKYYYDLNETPYGNVVSHVWWYTESGIHTVYFGTSNGYVFKMIDTGSSLELAAGWPFQACDEVTSSIITDGMNIYFGGRSGASYKIYAYVINSRALLFARNAASAVRATPSWDNSMGTTYLFAGSDYQELTAHSDLQFAFGVNCVTSSAASFITSGVEQGDVLVVTSGSQKGRYRIVSVDSENQLTLAFTSKFNENGIQYSAGQSPLIYRLDVSNQLNDKQNNSPLHHVRAATTYWPFSQGLYVGCYYGQVHGIDAFSDNFSVITGFPYSSAGITYEIRAMVYVEFVYHDFPPGPETRLMHGDMGGYFHVVNTDGSAYNPGNGAYPILLGGGAAIESSALPDNTGLIYIGNNNGKVFVIKESTKEVLKTYSFGAGVKIGDISYDSENGYYMVPTDEGRIYYLQGEFSP